jgi:hypothetical protein
LQNDVRLPLQYHEIIQYKPTILVCHWLGILHSWRVVRMFVHNNDEYIANQLNNLNGILYSNIQDEDTYVNGKLYALEFELDEPNDLRKLYACIKSTSHIRSICMRHTTIDHCYQIIVNH